MITSHSALQTGAEHADTALDNTQPCPARHAVLRDGLPLLSSTFTFWNVRAGDLPLTWDDAKWRIAGQERADAA